VLTTTKKETTVKQETGERRRRQETAANLVEQGFRCHRRQKKKTLRLSTHERNVKIIYRATFNRRTDGRHLCLSGDTFGLSIVIVTMILPFEREITVLISYWTTLVVH
jgi:hypothetical protein